MLDGALEGITYMFYPKVPADKMSECRKGGHVWIFLSRLFPLPFRSKYGETYKCGDKQPPRSSLPWASALGPLLHIPHIIPGTTTVTAMPSLSPL